MNELTMRFFAEHVAKERQTLDQLTGEIENYRLQLAAAEENHRLTAAHLRMLTNLQAQLNGEPGDLTAADVQADDDTLGITITGMSYAPDDGPLGAGLEAYAGAMRALYDAAHHQARLAQDAINERRGKTPPEGLPVPFVDPNPAEVLPVIQAAAIEAPPLADTGDCVRCGGRVTRTPSGLVHEATIRAVCYTDRPDSSYAELAHPFDVGPDEPNEEADVTEAPAQLRAFRVTFDRLGRQRTITPLELQALDDGHLARLIAIDAARILDTYAEDIEARFDTAERGHAEMGGHLLRKGKLVGRFTVEQIHDVLREPAADLVSAAGDEEASD